MVCPDDVTVAAWLGGRIDDATRMSIESHLDDCESCRALAADVVRGGRPTPKQLGRFELGACLGRGAMGEVYVALDPQLGRQVALKLPRAAGDVLHEARMMAQVRHPHVVAVYEVGTAGEIPYVVMEHVEGKDLASAGALPEATVVHHIAGVARALAAVHAVGLVHRDVKPANIILDSDGRARLGDFGLAGVEPATGTTDAPLDVTRTGELVGTPAYLAPELWEDRRATPASDQFALCVSLYELLYGVRPFAGDTLAELSANVRASKLREPPRSGRLAGVVRRGLARDPAARWPSLSALADALEPRPRGGWVALAAGVLITAGATFAHVTSRPATDPCGGAERELAGVWDPSHKAQIVSAFGASPLPFAAASSVRVTGALDRYAAAWSSAQREACVANRVRHVESDSLFDRRAACLADRKRQLAAFVDALAKPSPEIVERASAAAVALSPPAQCLAHDVRGLDDAPADPIRAAAFGDKLAAARVKFELGDYKGALAATEPLVAEVGALGSPRRESELHALRALVQARAGDDTAGEASFRAALDAAARAGDDALIVRAWAALINMLGSRPGKSAQALALVETAKLALVRAGSTPELEAALAVNVGSAQRRAGNLEAAHAELTRALALKEQVSGRDAVDNVSAMTNLANVLDDEGKVNESLALHERVVAIHTRTHGAEHPLTAQARANVAALLDGLGEHARAATEGRAALAILEPVWGADNRRILILRNNLAVALGNAGQPVEARATFERTLAFEAKAPQEAADALSGVAKLEIQAKRPDKAVEMLEKCLALRTKLVAADHPDLGVTATQLGDALTAANRCKDANVQFDRALAIYAAKLSPDHRLVGYALAGKGACLAKLGDAAGAKAALARARAIAETAQDPKLREITRAP